MYSEMDTDTVLFLLRWQKINIRISPWIVPVMNQPLFKSELLEVNTLQSREALSGVQKRRKVSLRWDEQWCMAAHWKDWRHIVFSRLPCDSRVSCLSQRVEVVLVLSFLQARWGSTAALCSKSLWEHFLLSNRGTAPPREYIIRGLPSVLCKHLARWSHCLFLSKDIKEFSLVTACRLCSVLRLDFMRLGDCAYHWLCRNINSNSSIQWHH